MMQAKLRQNVSQYKIPSVINLSAEGVFNSSIMHKGQMNNFNHEKQRNIRLELLATTTITRS